MGGQVLHYQFFSANGSSHNLGDALNLPQFDGHFEKGYTNLKGVSNEKEEGI
jgi:hypothetical protein